MADLMWQEKRDDQNMKLLATQQGHKIYSFEIYGFALLHMPSRPDVGIRCESVEDAKKKAKDDNS